MNRIIRYLSSLVDDANQAIRPVDTGSPQLNAALALGLDHPTYLRRRIVIDGLSGNRLRDRAPRAIPPGCHASR
jgi:hypothetical protein